jgi:nitronate monooxygenase
MQAVLDARPAAFSFTFGIPRDPWLQRFRDAGVATVGTATSVEEARVLEAAGVDAVCAQGAEAGAHRGTFLGEAASSLIGTIALVPLVVDAVALPVVASGGIGDGRGVAAALMLGASATQLGTAFLLAQESATSQAYRDALRAHSARDTTITTAFSGRSARGIRNRFVEELPEGSLRAPYPFQNAMTRDIRNAAAAAGRPEFLSLWAGQAFALARALPAAEIVRALQSGLRETLESARKLALPSAP